MPTNVVNKAAFWENLASILGSQYGEPFARMALQLMQNIFPTLQGMAGWLGPASGTTTPTATGAPVYQPNPDIPSAFRGYLQLDPSDPRYQLAAWYLENGKTSAADLRNFSQQVAAAGGASGAKWFEKWRAKAQKAGWTAPGEDFAQRYPGWVQIGGAAGGGLNLESPSIPSYLKPHLSNLQSPLGQAALMYLVSGRQNEQVWDRWKKDVAKYGNNPTWFAKWQANRVKEGYPLPTAENLQAAGYWVTPTAGTGAGAGAGGGEETAASQPWFFNVPRGAVELPEAPEYQAGELPPAYQVSPEVISALTQTPDWREPFTPSQLAALRAVSQLSATGTARQQAENLMSALARRGLGGSGLEASQLAAIQNLYDLARAQAEGQIALQGMERGDRLRAEAAGSALSLEGLRQASVADAMQRYLTSQGLAAQRRAEQTQRAMTQEEMERARRQEGAANYFNLLQTLMGGSSSMTGQSQLPAVMQAMQNTGEFYGNLAGLYAKEDSDIWSGIGNILGAVGALAGLGGLGGGGSK